MGKIWEKTKKTEKTKEIASKSLNLVLINLPEPQAQQ